MSTTCASGPALVVGQKEQFEASPVPRSGFPPPYWNAVVAERDEFINLPQSTGAHYRPGWRMYPYTTELSPMLH